MHLKLCSSIKFVFRARGGTAKHKSCVSPYHPVAPGLVINTEEILMSEFKVQLSDEGVARCLAK